MEGERHPLQQCRGRDVIGGVSTNGHEHHAVASTACALRLLGHHDHDGIGRHQLGRASVLLPSTPAASTSTTSPGRTRSSNALSARGSAHDARVRARHRFGQPRPEHAHVGQHLPAPGGAGQRRTDDSIDVRLRALWNRCRRAVFEPHIVGGQFDPEARSRVATTISVRSPSGSERSAITAARMTRAPATSLRAASVRVQSGRAASSRLRTDGLSESPMPTR